MFTPDNKPTKEQRTRRPRLRCRWIPRSGKGTPCRKWGIRSPKALVYDGLCLRHFMHEFRRRRNAELEEQYESDPEFRRVCDHVGAREAEAKRERERDGFAGVLKHAPDPAKVLGIKPGSSPEEINEAFRSAARSHHPDYGGDPEKFRSIVQARNELLKGKYVHITKPA